MPEPMTAAALSAAANIATSAIGSEIAGSVIDKATEAIEKITENAAIRFSNVGQDLIAQIEVSIEELLDQLGAEIDQTVAELDDTLKVQIYNLSLTVEKLVKATMDDLDELSDDIVRDIRATLSRTWFFSEIFMLDEIEGTLIPSNIVSDWELSASGLNLGYDSDEIESVVKLKVNMPNAVPFTQVGAEVDAHTVKFTLPLELINELRKDTQLVTLDAELDFKLKKDGFLWFDDKYKGKQPFKLLIAPRIAGTLFASGTRPTYGWVKNPELDIVYSNDLPNGHATSSSKVGHHRITRYFNIARASVPPREGDKRFYAGQPGSCTGGGCSHLHEFRVSVTNNGSTLDVYTYNNSHAITVRVIGKIERYQKTSDNGFTLPQVPIESSKALEIEFPKGFENARIVGRDMDHGPIDLTIKRKTSTTVYPMPSGKFGGLEFLGTDTKPETIIYRFWRKE